MTNYSEYDSTGANVVYSRTASYDNRSQVTSDQTTAVRSDGTWVWNATYDYNLYNSATGTYTGAYQGGVATHVRQTMTKNGG